METRVSKYKNYRAQIITEDAPETITSKEAVNDEKMRSTFSGSATTTLSYSDVYGRIQEEDNKEREQKQKDMRRIDILKKVGVGFACAVVIIGLIVFAAIVF